MIPLPTIFVTPYFIKPKANLGYTCRKPNLYNSIGFHKGHIELKRKKNFNTMFWNTVLCGQEVLSALWN